MSHKNDLSGLRKILMELGFDYADDRRAKAALALKFCEVIDACGLSQEEAAFRTGMTPRMASQIRRRKLEKISLKRLMQALVALDQHVEIVVRPARMTLTSGITVAA